MTKLTSPLLLLLLLPVVVTAWCPGNCYPNGSCVDGQCKCDKGYDGLDCSFPYVTCPDGIQVCFNGASCVPDGFPDAATFRQMYKCNCDAAYGISFTDGKECEHPHSAECEEGASTSDYAFCTNGGECIKFIQRGQDHAGCKCTDDFEGRHCQYEKGKAPREELLMAQQFGGVQKSGHWNVLTVFIVLVVVGSVVGYFGRFVYQKWERKHTEDTSERHHKRVKAQLRDLTMTESKDEGETAENEVDTPVVVGTMA
jgi:hypothetical protein